MFLLDVSVLAMELRINLKHGNRSWNIVSLKCIWVGNGTFNLSEAIGCEHESLERNRVGKGTSRSI